MKRRERKSYRTILLLVDKMSLAIVDHGTKHRPARVAGTHTMHDGISDSETFPSIDSHRIVVVGCCRVNAWGESPCHGFIGFFTFFSFHILFYGALPRWVITHPP